MCTEANLNSSLLLIKTLKTYFEQIFSRAKQFRFWIRRERSIIPGETNLDSFFFSVLANVSSF